MRVMILVVAGMMILVASASPTRSVREVVEEQTDPIMSQLPADTRGPLDEALDQFWTTIEPHGDEVWGEVEDVIDTLQDSLACVRGSVPLHMNHGTSIDRYQLGTSDIFVGAASRISANSAPVPHPGALAPNVLKLGINIGQAIECGGGDRPNPNCDYQNSDGCSQSDYFRNGAEAPCDEVMTQCLTNPNSSLEPRYPYVLLNPDKPSDNDLHPWLELGS